MSYYTSYITALTNVSHCLGMSYYVNFSGGLGSNKFHIKFLAEQLTLSQPGGQIMPTTVLSPGFSNFATALSISTNRFQVEDA